MALAIDASTPAKVTGTGLTVVTVSFTPPAGSLVVLLYAANNPAATDCSLSGVTNGGTAITWTRRARKSTNSGSTGGAGTNGAADLWTGVGNGGAITVTATSADGSTGAGHEKMLQPVVLTGADTANLANVIAASSTSGLPSCVLPSCLAGSYCFACSSDWAAAGLGTPGTGQTIPAGWEFNTSGQMTMHGWRTTNPLAANGSQTMNLTAPAAQQYNVVALEIRDAGGPAAAPKPAWAYRTQPPRHHREARARFPG